jgi:hypothetical protein
VAAVCGDQAVLKALLPSADTAATNGAGETLEVLLLKLHGLSVQDFLAVDLDENARHASCTTQEQLLAMAQVSACGLPACHLPLYSGCECGFFWDLLFGSPPLPHVLVVFGIIIVIIYVVVVVLSPRRVVVCFMALALCVIVIKSLSSVVVVIVVILRCRRRGVASSLPLLSALCRRCHAGGIQLPAPRRGEGRGGRHAHLH